MQTIQGIPACMLSIKDLGPLKYFLGINVAKGPQGLFLCQRKYAFEMIDECGLLGAKLVEFPMKQNHHLALAQGKLLANPTQHRRLVECLIYLTITKPNLTFVVHILSQFM